MMIDKTSTFRCIFHKNLHHIQVFDVRYEWQSGSGSGNLLPLPAFASKSLVTTLPNTAFYLRKTSKRLKLPGLRPNFCQISIVRQHSKYKDYKPIQKYEDVNTAVTRLLRATATCNLATVTLTQDVASILIRFLCNTGSRELSIYFSTLTPTPDSGKNQVQIQKKPSTPSTPTLQHWFTVKFLQQKHRWAS